MAVEETLAYKINLAWPKTYEWHKMDAGQVQALSDPQYIGGLVNKPVKWGKFLNRWVCAWAMQKILPCGWIYRVGLRNGKTFDYLVVHKEEVQ
jgi:hypothetical protein